MCFGLNTQIFLQIERPILENRHNYIKAVNLMKPNKLQHKQFCVMKANQTRQLNWLVARPTNQSKKHKKPKQVQLCWTSCQHWNKIYDVRNFNQPTSFSFHRGTAWKASANEVIGRAVTYITRRCVAAAVNKSQPNVSLHSELTSSEDVPAGCCCCSLSVVASLRMLHLLNLDNISTSLQ